MFTGNGLNPILLFCLKNYLSITLLVRWQMQTGSGVISAANKPHASKQCAGKYSNATSLPLLYAGLFPKSTLTKGVPVTSPQWFPEEQLNCPQLPAVLSIKLTTVDKDKKVRHSWAFHFCPRQGVFWNTRKEGQHIWASKQLGSKFPKSHLWFSKTCLWKEVH